MANALTAWAEGFINNQFNPQKDRYQTGKFTNLGSPYNNVNAALDLNNGGVMNYTETDRQANHPIGSAIWDQIPFSGLAENIIDAISTPFARKQNPNSFSDWIRGTHDNITKGKITNYDDYVKKQKEWGMR